MVFILVYRKRIMSSAFVIIALVLKAILVVVTRSCFIAKQRNSASIVGGASFHLRYISDLRTNVTIT